MLVNILIFACLLSSARGCVTLPRTFLTEVRVVETYESSVIEVDSIRAVLRIRPNIFGWSAEPSDRAPLNKLCSRLASDESIIMTHVSNCSSDPRGVDILKNTHQVSSEDR